MKAAVMELGRVSSAEAFPGAASLAASLQARAEEGWHSLCPAAYLLTSEGCCSPGAPWGRTCPSQPSEDTVPALPAARRLWGL